LHLGRHGVVHVRGESNALVAQRRRQNRADVAEQRARREANVLHNNTTRL
jgi:hypothetical protein